MSSSINLNKCDPEAHRSESVVMNSTLTQQSSIHAVTFDELQNTLGGSTKDFESMHMDVLLKNIWASEERQTIVPDHDSGVTNNAYLQKQGSLNLPRTRSQKTIDEVWRELLKEDGGFKGVDLIKEPNLQPQEKQPALNETTLEEFLRKAGLVSENGQKHPNQNKGFHQLAAVTDSKTEVNNLQGVRSSQQPKPQKILPKIAPKQATFNFTSSLKLVNKAQMGSGVNEVSTIGKCDYPTNLFPNSNLDRSPSPPSYAYGEGGVCGRHMGGSLEKGVERRRKRMIKNRESASRSRARKQAYTLELETEVAKLKQLNHELKKKQEEIMESHNFQVPEKSKSWENRKLCLRRTLTAPW